MRWNTSTVVTGIQSLFGNLSPEAITRVEMSLDTIRQAMLETLGVAGANAYPGLRLRVSYANDLQDLWYLRGDIMAALAVLEGEVAARTKIDLISVMFRGLLPRGMHSRPSPLGA